MGFSVGVSMCGSYGGVGGCSDGDGICVSGQVGFGWRGHEHEVELE